LAPYEALVFHVLNSGDYEPGIEFYARGGTGPEEAEFAVALPLPPGEWQTVSIRIADIGAAGVDTSAVGVIGFRAPLGDTPRPSRIVVDHIRIVGTDARAARKARRAEDATASRRRPRGATGSGAAAFIPRPGVTGRASPNHQAPWWPAGVLVVGGGLAGVRRAVTAARMGADVLPWSGRDPGWHGPWAGLRPASTRADGRYRREDCRRLDEAGGTRPQPES
jgi:hypothetical protein